MQGTNRPPVDLVRNPTPHRCDTRFHRQRRHRDSALAAATPSPRNGVGKRNAAFDRHRECSDRPDRKPSACSGSQGARSIAYGEIEPIGTQPSAGEATSSSRRQGRRVQVPRSCHPVTALPAESEISGSATLASISVTLFPNSETKMRNCCHVPGNWIRCSENLAACVGSAEQVESVGGLFAGGYRGQ